MDEQEYLKERVDNQLKWYSKRSKWNQVRHKTSQLLQIVFAATIPFLAGNVTETPELKYAIGILGVCVAILAGITSLYKFQENWIQYRTTAESLKHEKFLFVTKTEPYNTENALHDFVQRVEALISKEHSTWTKFTKAKPKEQ